MRRAKTRIRPLTYFVHWMADVTGLAELFELRAGTSSPFAQACRQVVPQFE